ncbi:unnamed protein product [Miscanthus lutarioriparius]|uniref:SKP1 component dimerisation domain-containing protein n=1 Tax=Miscanthus lutarioriparius TaxID=422564 RepID=A0A811SDQ5_9POAL|nr:unnamed protein product [Miscanthus lutarioriparius]
MFDLDELVKATNGFSCMLKVRKGGFGSVYRAFFCSTGSWSSSLLSASTITASRDFWRNLRLQTTWTSRGLLNLTCLSVTDMMKGKTPEDIHEKFNIKNDFTAEEEEEVMRE